MQNKSHLCTLYSTVCFLNTVERQTLFNLVEQLVPNFNKLNKHKKYEVLVMGINSDNPDYYHTNTRITYAVKIVIFKTKISLNNLKI